MNDPQETDQPPMHRFILALWYERRDRAGAPEVLRGSITSVSPEGGTPPKRAFFQSADGLQTALLRLLRLKE